MDQMVDTSTNARPIRVIERAKAHDGPRGLGSGTGSLPFENRIVIGITSLAPASVLVLDAFKPVARFEQPRLIHINVEGTQPAQHLPGAIDVINAPAPVPRSVFLLVF